MKPRLKSGSGNFRALVKIKDGKTNRVKIPGFYDQVIKTSQKEINIFRNLFCLRRKKKRTPASKVLLVIF